MINYDSINAIVELMDKETWKIYFFDKIQFLKISIRYKDINFDEDENIFNLEIFIPPIALKQISHRYHNQRQFYTNA
ncbi:hypothetical protein HZS_1491, partial [Henneguya salminicola]